MFLWEDYEKAEMQRGFKMGHQCRPLCSSEPFCKYQESTLTCIAMFDCKSVQVFRLSEDRGFLIDIMKIRVGGLGGWGVLPVISVYFCMVT